MNIHQLIRDVTALLDDQQGFTFAFWENFKGILVELHGQR